MHAIIWSFGRLFFMTSSKVDGSSKVSSNICQPARGYIKKSEREKEGFSEIGKNRFVMAGKLL